MDFIIGSKRKKSHTQREREKETEKQNQTDTHTDRVHTKESIYLSVKTELHHLQSNQK